jgi:anthranilate phosphoribosyltransferase
MIIAYVFITTAPGKEKKVLGLVGSGKSVSEAYRLYGEYDIIVKIEVEELAEVDKFVISKIRSLPEVKQTSTMIAM